MTGTLHVVGAGMAGLAAAVAAARAGTSVVLHEAAGHAGGRCRSFHDATLDRLIDNGSHLVLGANRFTLAYARAIGGDEAMLAVPPVFPFLDLADGACRMVTPSRPGAGPLELLAALGLPWTRGNETVARRLGRTRSFARLWRPLCEAILNTAPEEASARLLGRVLRRVFLGGRPAMTPWTFPLGLSAALVAPALATLASFGARVRFRHSLTAVSRDGLVFEDDAVALGPHDRAILALPPWALRQLMPDQAPDLPLRAIVNVHFRLPEPRGLPGGTGFLGLIGGTAQWLFLRGDVLSVTVSAADALAEHPPAEVARMVWQDCSRAIGLADAAVPPARVLKERRATLAHAPDVLPRRPGPRTPFPAIVLAGDWLASPWPCTIEAAISTGLAAARLALKRPDLTFSR